MRAEGSSPFALLTPSYDELTLHFAMCISYMSETYHNLEILGDRMGSLTLAKCPGLCNRLLESYSQEEHGRTLPRRDH